MSELLSGPPAVDRLLIVDDEERQSDEIRMVANRIGFRDVSHAESESKANKLINGGDRFSLAVVDIMLSHPPGQNEGFRVIEQLHKEQPECRIIALTRKGRNNVGVQALRRGASDFVCGDWEYINWIELLQQRLSLWRDVAKSEQPEDDE